MPRAKTQMPRRSRGVEWARPIYLGSKENLYGLLPQGSQYTPSPGALPRSESQIIRQVSQFNLGKSPKQIRIIEIFTSTLMRGSLPNFYRIKYV